MIRFFSASSAPSAVDNNYTAEVAEFAEKDFSLFFEIIYHPSYAILQQHHIEINQQPDS